MTSIASRDCRGPVLLLTAAGLLLFAQNLTIPSAVFFDETHYVPAARTLLALEGRSNIEHPLLAKTFIAAGIALFGDNALGWRIFSPLFGALALLGAMRSVWWLSLSRAATLMTGLFVLAGQMVFVQARIAMLDIYMLGFLMAGLWLFCAALRHEKGNRIRLAGSGLLLGCAVASKWSGATVAMLPGLAFAAWRLAVLPAEPRQWMLNGDGPPVKGVSLLTAFLLLGLLPVAVYLASFAPMLFYRDDPLAWHELIAFQGEMLRTQALPMAPHTYQSRWWQWVLDLRPVWYLYEVADGAQRGVLLVGNPVVMWPGALAVLLCGVLGPLRRDRAMVAVALAWLAALVPWIIAPKAVQFYYHYLPASVPTAAALALALDRLWLRDGKRVVPAVICVTAVAMAAWYLPILSAWPLPDGRAFERYMLLGSWR